MLGYHPAWWKDDEVSEGGSFSVAGIRTSQNRENGRVSMVESYRVHRIELPQVIFERGIVPCA